MVGRSHQHRLVDQPVPLVDGVEHVVDDQPGLGRGVVAAHQPGPAALRAGRPQLEPMTGRVLLMVRPDRVGQVEQRLPGAEVLLQRTTGRASGSGSRRSSRCRLSAPRKP